MLSQTTGVVSGQHLIATGAHWIPDSLVSGQLCSPAYRDVGLGACNGPGTPYGVTSTGRIRLKVYVTKGSTGSMGYACRKKCIIVLYERDNNAISASAKFTFAE